MLREREGHYQTQSHLNNYLLTSHLPFMHMSSTDQKKEIRYRASRSTSFAKLDNGQAYRRFVLLV